MRPATRSGLRSQPTTIHRDTDTQVNPHDSHGSPPHASPSPIAAPPPRKIDSLLAPLAEELAAVEAVLHQELSPYRERFPELLNHLQAYQGKRLRPALLLLVARSCGHTVPAHYTLAAVVEMIHTATLIHDDVLDEAAQRRHLPTVHARWGNKTAILLGDLLFTHAFHLAASVDQRACRLIGSATNRVCAGELLQWAERGHWHLPEAKYLRIIDDKTAALTECAAQLGAVYAGGTEEMVQAACLYGRSLGRAFQIIDDLLDLTGREDTAGKTLGTDLIQGKATLPIIHALSQMPRNEAEEFCQMLQNGQSERYSYILAVLQRQGSLEYARRRAEEALHTARAALLAFPPSTHRDLLDSLIDWSLQRNV
jgi:octaprenyl-diphosphate synthase